MDAVTQSLRDMYKSAAWISHTDGLNSQTFDFLIAPSNLHSSFQTQWPWLVWFEPSSRIKIDDEEYSIGYQKERFLSLLANIPFVEALEFL